MSCKNICDSPEFIESFAVRKTIAKLPESVKRLFGYCSKCCIYLISKPIVYCKCCSAKIRTTLRDSRNLEYKYQRQKYREWYAENKEQWKERCKFYRRNNIEHIKEVNRAYYQNNIEKKRNYYQKNKEIILQKQRERRSRKKQNAL